MARSSSPNRARQRTGAAPAAGSGAHTTSLAAHKYSVLLPTYEERENLPLITAMLDQVFTEK